jgi:hypothetical protein
MSCGNLILQDPSGGFWILHAADNGQLLTSKTPIPQLGFVAPLLNSPSITWQLSALTNGVITATAISAQSAPSSSLLSSLLNNRFSLSIADTGILMTTSQGIGPVNVVPYPTNVQMSQFPPLGLISSVAGATPLTVSADFSIWSCTLNRFINEDTTNIIVVLDE